MTRKNTKFVPAKSSAKDTREGIDAIIRIVRRFGWSYEEWRYVSKRVLAKTDIHPERTGRKLPRVLTAAEFTRFYEAIDKAKDPQHALMLRMLFYTGCRVSELCRIQVTDVDLDACKVRISQGKGSKDRYVLFSKGFATALRTFVKSRPHHRYLFQSRKNTKFGVRQVQYIVGRYARQADVTATPHTFRHQMITHLSRHSGLADAELQVLTGHARRDTLAVYQHVALDAALEAKYHQAMKALDL